MTRIRVLGPIEVQVDGRPVELGGPRQRAVLGMLVAARRGVVSTDRLIEDLWRGQPPPSATASLQAYVSKLRRLLEPGRSPRAPARLLVSAPPGYVLRVRDEQVDAWRFEGLVRQAGELGLWLTRCGGPRVEIAVAPPYSLELDGDWHRAQAVWQERGVPYEAALCALRGNARSASEAVKRLRRMGAAAAVAALARQRRQRGPAVPRARRPATQADPLG